MKLEGTIWVPKMPKEATGLDYPPIGLGVGHGGAFPAEIVDVLVIEQTSVLIEETQSRMLDAE